jgi:SMI1 / KNR4 family (SUKH-1)
MAFDISEEQVAATELQIGRKLPPTYRSMMMANNGGTAVDDEDQWDVHPIRDTSDRKRLSRSCNHILAETKSAQEWRGFPKDALAIGGNGFGDVMLLLPSPSDNSVYGDRIYAFWHETGEVKPLADDLSAFEIE